MKIIKNGWDFFQDQILGMHWLKDLIGKLLVKAGLGEGRFPGEFLHFFLYDIIKIFVLLAVLIFALLGYVVFRSTRKQKVEEPEPELSVDALLAATSDNDDENLEDIGYSEKSETRKLIEKFVDENPDAAALLLRNWLNDDWE